ncbi:MAG: hypothetical protein IPK26_29775 [Planctomycetes bacterium]|nr:hypothetical protein [Planctomycetota bacterium]
MKRLLPVLAAIAAWSLLTAPLCAQGKEYYVSANRGKGKKATKEQPAKDLGNIIELLQPGDTVHIAGGVYTGRSDCGRDQINVPIHLIGGYDDDFTSRDPWGATPTVFGGDNVAQNFAPGIRLEIGTAKNIRGTPPSILVDGLIIDNGTRNQYSDDGAILQRRFQPRTGKNASPDAPGLAIACNLEGIEITVQNCIVMNCGPTGKRGALEVKGFKDGKVTIRNNLVVNNTSGIACLSGFRPSGQDGLPKFTVENNTVLFTWKYDPIATHGGCGLVLEPTFCKASNNVFGYGDCYGVSNGNGGPWQNLTLANNAFVGNLMGEYLEFNTVLASAAFADEASKLTEGSEGNSTITLTAKVTPEWAARYAARQVIDRQQAEAEVEATNSRANDLRRMLGLPLAGGSISASSEVWMHRLPLADALAIGRSMPDGRGCANPSQAPATPK